MQKHRGRNWVLGLGAASLLWLAAPALRAQGQMPDPKQISGKALPDPSVPAGTVLVRVVRGNINNKVPNQPVDFVIDGAKRAAKTDDDGLAQVAGLKNGSRVKVSTTLDGQTIPSDEVTLSGTGVRFMLVADDPDAAKREAADRALAMGPATKGVVVLGPESRVFVQLEDDRLQMFYLIQVVNTARTPIDAGGPLIVDLPTGARGASLMDGSSRLATVIGPRLTITGPFPPGVTQADVAFEMPYSGNSVEVKQRWPAALQQATVVALKGVGLDVQSSQLSQKREMNDQGQALVVATGPAISAGSALTFAITGLPHVALWPRYLALVMAGALVAIGLWAAFIPR